MNSPGFFGGYIRFCAGWCGILLALVAATIVAYISPIHHFATESLKNFTIVVGACTIIFSLFGFSWFYRLSPSRWQKSVSFIGALFLGFFLLQVGILPWRPNMPPNALKPIFQLILFAPLGFWLWAAIRHSVQQTNAARSA